jgi:hypothetical protein
MSSCTRTLVPVLSWSSGEARSSLLSIKSLYHWG